MYKEKMRFVRSRIYRAARHFLPLSPLFSRDFSHSFGDCDKRQRKPILTPFPRGVNVACHVLALFSRRSRNVEEPSFPYISSTLAERISSYPLGKK